LGRDDAEVRERVRAWHASTRMGGSPQLVGTVQQVADALRQYEAVGVERAMLQQLVHEDIAMVSLLGELAEAVAT
jgi:alkanesulfonate monooxygenase SsuD/methylene tetrahydromethanopterin reductase-like flavin-dependent oxidoreductase (luciferase family)